MTIDTLLGIDGDKVQPSARWGNLWGATFGGYVAAVLLRAFERAAPPGQALAGAHINFAHPLKTDPAAHLSVEVHRSGRSATAMSGRIDQGTTTTTVGVAWATAEPDHLTLVEVRPPDVGPPEAYERQTDRSGRSPFIDDDMDIRKIPTPDSGTLTIQWMRLTQLGVGADDPWPAPALGLVADMIGAGQYRAAQLTMGEGHGAMSLDLGLHIAAPPRGPWVLGVFEHVALDRGRTIGRGLLYDREGAFCASLTQQSLVRVIP